MCWIDHSAYSYLSEMLSRRVGTVVLVLCPNVFRLHHNKMMFLGMSSKTLSPLLCTIHLKQFVSQFLCQQVIPIPFTS